MCRRAGPLQGVHEKRFIFLPPNRLYYLVGLYPGHLTELPGCPPAVNISLATRYQYVLRELCLSFGDINALFMAI